MEFKTVRYRVKVNLDQYRVQEPFSAVFLSDMHNLSYGEANAALLAEIRNANPAMVLVAGDMLTSGNEVEMDAAVALMNELTKKYPVYYANGNHEHRMKVNTEKYGDAYVRYADTIKSFGVHLLENTCERMNIKKIPVTVWGLELEGGFFRKGRCPELTAQQITEILGSPHEGAYNILLAHHPAYGDVYAKWGADLTLSGHLHGGIIRLPVLGGLISPQLRPFPKYDRGLYDISGRKLIVSGGLGSHTIPVRINNPPQLVVIDFI